MSDRSTDLMRTLRAADPDRYLSMLYAPQDRRADLLALYAFNAEIAGIRDRVSEPMPGEIRLQPRTGFQVVSVHSMLDEVATDPCSRFGSWGVKIPVLGTHP